ncbi:hypothetical protein EIP86_007679 [Pleurotus ostreatoroseus]|nr:hypothetical protein EIP86_007679 [Pleurotus ostreatoroseus]
MPAIEIVTFPSCEAYRKDPSISFPIFDIVEGHSKGWLGMYYGLQVEDGKTGYFTIVWETLEDHQNLINDPIYAKLIEHVKQCVEGGGLDGLEMIHVPFEPVAALATIYNGPFTSFAHVTPKPGKTVDDINADLALLRDVKDVQGNLGLASGKVIEKEDAFVFTSGWDQIENHAAAAKGHPGISAFVAKLNEDAEWGAKHVSLKSYKKKYEA